MDLGGIWILLWATRNSHCGGRICVELVVREYLIIGLIIDHSGS